MGDVGYPDLRATFNTIEDRHSVGQRENEPNEDTEGRLDVSRLGIMSIKDAVDRTQGCMELGFIRIPLKGSVMLQIRLEMVDHPF